MRYWCEDCESATVLNAHGKCQKCGGTAVAPRLPAMCRLCGGGVDEGPMVGGMVHFYCIPTYLRRKGDGEVQRFLSRLITQKEMAR